MSMLNKDKELFEFLSNAPKEFREGEQIKKFQMKNGDFIHCVLWNMHFYITGTDIVKILLYRFQTGGRQLINLKKFEEGIFSDLRNLKPGIDATLEGPRSEFLEFLYKNGCIRTQKKQKVFYWYSVPHDALFCDALERDLRRESNLQSYNKYISSLTRPPTEINNYNINSYVQQRPLTEMDPRINKNIDRLQIRPQSANFFDLNTDQKRMFDVQQSQPFNTKSGSNIKVYPEFDNFEHDAFYREDVTKGTMDDFYSPSINKQINPSDFSISKGPTNNFNISKGLSHDFYSLNNKQNNLSDFSRSVSQPSLNLNDFDFLKERMEARVKEEEEKKNVASKKSMSQREQFELFRKY